MKIAAMFFIGTAWLLAQDEDCTICSHPLTNKMFKISRTPTELTAIEIKPPSLCCENDKPPRLDSTISLMTTTRTPYEEFLGKLKEMGYRIMAKTISATSHPLCNPHLSRQLSLTMDRVDSSLLSE